MHRDNLKFHLRKYQYKRQKKVYEDCYDSSNDNDDGYDNDTDDETNDKTTETSPWYSAVDKIKNLTEDRPVIVYLDYVRDVEQVVEVLHDIGIKAAKYTGRMTIADRNEAEKAFLEGRTSILVATESYELGVNNPNVSEIVRVGSPRNLGVLLQEFGRAGRKAGVIANAYLFFNESMDDKRLGLWLKSSLESENDAAHEAVKADILSTYKKTWQYVYSVYHGKCLMWAMSHFYGGVDDEDPPTCFTANAPLCMTCEFSDNLCEISQDIKSHLSTLLATVKSLHSIGLTSITKTLLVGTLMGTISQYIERHERMDEIIDKTDTCWGCGVFVDGIRMAAFAWHKVICVAIHLSLLDLTFVFRPFDNHIEVHRRLCLSTLGENFLTAPQTVMSPNPLSTIIDRLLGASKDSIIHNKVQNRGIQLKPHIIRLLEERQWEEGSIDALKYIGYGNEGDICLYFSDCQALPAATSDVHYLLKIPQLSRSQATIKKLEATIDGKTVTLFANRSYCSGVKKCAGDECEYTVSKKQKINRCLHHPTSALIPTGPCSCHMVYVYPEEPHRDGRRWFMVLNSQSSLQMHNHPPPSEWKISPRVLNDISNAVSRNSHITPKEIQKGLGMDYRPMEVSIAAANIDRMRAVVNKSKKEIYKVDNEQVNPFKIIASFPSIKSKIDLSCVQQGLDTSKIDEMVGKYQLDGDGAYYFTRDRRFAFFQSPFQAVHWSKAVALFVDIDYTSNHHFPYLLNIVCLNNVTSKYMACGRVLMNKQDGSSIGRALTELSQNVKDYVPTYNIKLAHKEILLDFDEAEANGFREAFRTEIANLLRGCSVHFIRSALRVAKLVNVSQTSLGYQIFMAVAKLIPDNSSKEIVLLAFNILSGTESYTKLSEKLPSSLVNSQTVINTSQWKTLQTWTDWWTRPQVLRKLSKAFSELDKEDWDDLPGTNNPVESINKQSIPPNSKSVSLKPLVEHMYLEDRRQAVLQVATEKGVSISYRVTKSHRRTRRAPKAPEKRAALTPLSSGKRAVGLRVSVEFYNDDSRTSTTWFKGTVISYSRKGYVVSFDGCGPEENEVIYSLKQGIDKGEVKLL